jgi:solute carrier family 35, member E3
VIGMVLYSYFCTRETQQKPAEASPQAILQVCSATVS